MTRKEKQFLEALKRLRQAALDVDRLWSHEVAELGDYPFSLSSFDEVAHSVSAWVSEIEENAAP